MKKFSNFWKYFTITILLLLGLVCAGILYMFFLGAPLFNFRYVSYNKNHYSSEYNIVENQIKTVKLVSNKFDVKILDSSTDNVSLKVHNGVFGFTTKQSATFNLSESLESEILTFTVIEPHGFAATGSSSIELYIPQTESGINLILSNTGAKTVLNSTSIIQNLSYTTRSGEFVFSQGSILGQMNLSLGRAKFSIADEVETNMNEVNLKMTSGSFNCPNKEFDVINLLSSTSGVLRAGKCNEINGENENAGGSITISQVGRADLVAGDTNVRITNLTYGIIDISKTGRIEIEEIEGIGDLRTKSGRIWVGKSLSELNCTTSSGNITVDKAVKVINAETASGNVYINFDFEGNVNSVQEQDIYGAKKYSYETFNSYSKDKDYRRVIAKTDSGTINCYGVENVDVNITGSGRANIYMENVLGDNIIKAEKKGSVYVQVKEFNNIIMPYGWSHFELTTQSNAGYVKVNFTQMEATSGYSTRAKTTTKINLRENESTSNYLSVYTNSGSLTVLDTITARI